MKTYVERVVKVSFSPDEMRFQTDAELDAFHMALGRMLAYGMASDAERSLDVVVMGIDKSHEITAAYWPGWSRGEGYTHNQPQYDLDNSLRAFQMSRPFVMGAVPRDGGINYSYHS